VLSGANEFLSLAAVITFRSQRYADGATRVSLSISKHHFGVGFIYGGMK